MYIYFHNVITIVSVKTSKFRHLKGEPLHKSHRIENIRSLSNSVSGESDGLALNRSRCAISLQGPAGLVAVLEVINRLLPFPHFCFPHITCTDDYMGFCIIYARSAQCEKYQYS